MSQTSFGLPPAPAETGRAAPRRQTGPAEHLQELLERIQGLPDSVARGLAEECVHSVIELYGEGLARVLQLLDNEGEQGRAVLDGLLGDKLLCSLLLVHGLHPHSLETRLLHALEKVRPYMQSHGGNVELVSLRDDQARLRFNGACQSCPSSAVTMELAIRQAVEEACPDLAGLELESAPAKPHANGAQPEGHAAGGCLAHDHALTQRAPEQ